MLILGFVVLALSFYWNNIYISIPLKIISIGFILFTLWFFRDPDRTVPKEANEDQYVISPADGVLMEIEEEIEPHYINGKCKRISIFLSPLDVHVNRSPVNGIVELSEYHPGEFLAAYKPKSSELNEHTRIGVKNSAGKVFFKQIVGIAARRIVNELKPGDTVKSGDKFGMMKFGSRMDLSFPPETELLIEKGQRVVAGETILAKIIDGGNGGS